VQVSPTRIVLLVLKNVLVGEMVFPLVPLRIPAHASFRKLSLTVAPPPAGPPNAVQVLSRWIADCALPATVLPLIVPPFEPHKSIASKTSDPSKTLFSIVWSSAEKAPSPVVTPRPACCRHDCG
jgi:hypothetical protein